MFGTQDFDANNGLSVMSNARMPFGKDAITAPYDRLPKVNAGR